VIEPQRVTVFVGAFTIKERDLYNPLSAVIFASIPTKGYAEPQDRLQNV
jgi:hypothetical protein